MTPERSDNLFFSDGGTERALLVEIVERLNSFINRWEGLRRDLSLTISLQSLRARQNTAQLVKILSDTTQQNV